MAPWQRSQFMMQLLMINLVACFACLCGIAFAQFEFSEAISGSVTFPDVAFACIGNLAVFFTSLLRGRLDLENGARDVLATNRGPQLVKTNESEHHGWTTCNGDGEVEVEGDGEVEGGRKYKDAAVLMLSRNTSDPSIMQFMRYIQYSHGIDSILLKGLPLRDATDHLAKFSCHDNPDHFCECILLWTEENEIGMMVHRMPRTLKKLSDSVCLLPSRECLTRGCHGCDQGLLNVKESGEMYDQLQPEWRSREEDFNVVCQILNYWEFNSRDKHACMCIPLREAEEDEWTKLVIRLMRSKDTEGRGVRVLASDAMEKYIDRSGESGARVTTDIIRETYTGFSLLVQRFIEIIVNVLLTWWLRVDGLSSSLIARRVVRDYLVDSKGTGFAANAFLTEAYIRCNQSSVCQVLRFRGKILGVRTLAYVVGCVNLICSIGWVVLIASEGSVGKGYVIHSTPPSKYRVVVVLVGIGIALLMDCLVLCFLYLLSDGGVPEIRELSENKIKKKIRMVYAMMVLEILYIVAGCVIVIKGLGMQKSSGKGRWVYSALQILIWVKWGIGSYLLGDRDDRVDYSRLQERSHEVSWVVDLDSNHGVMVYSSAFMLNAILAGVRGKWES